MSSNQIVIATTTRYPKKEDLRLQLALQTLHQAHLQDIRMVVVDGSASDIRQMLKQSKAHVFDEPAHATMGNGRRFALEEAGRVAGFCF